MQGIGLPKRYFLAPRVTFRADAVWDFTPARGLHRLLAARQREKQ